MNLANIKQSLASPSVSKALLVICALIWGFSFFIMKDATASFPVFWLLAVRFFMAAAFMLIFFWRRITTNLNPSTIRIGILLGIYEWGGYAFQTVGITMTTPGKNAFLTGCYCVLVPFVAYLWGMGKPRRRNVVAAFICLAGLGLVALDNGFPLNMGDLLTLVGAVFFALQMVELSSQGKGRDIMALTFWEFLIVAVGSLVLALFLEQPPALALFTLDNVLMIVFLAIVCSCVCLIILNHAFSVVDPSQAALLSSLESPSGVAFSVMFAGELLTPRLVGGFALIFFAIALSEVGPQMLAALSKLLPRKDY